MNNHKFFRNAALAFGLLAAGSSFAAETSATAPAAKTPEQREAISTEIRSKMANMTPEQRTAFREEMQAKAGKMTPEQREAFRNDRRAQMANMTPEQRETFRDKMQAEHHEAHADINHEHMHPSDMHGAGNMHPR